MSKDRLFELISQLTPSERRYFKQSLKRHSDNPGATSFARLFDYFTKVKEYNREELLLKCDFIKASQLQNVKFRLYKHLLASLRSYNSSKTSEFTMHELIIDARILLNKGLFDQALNSLDTAEKIVRNNEYVYMLDKILEEQEGILTRYSRTNSDKNRLLEVQSKRLDRKEALFRESQLNTINSISYNIFRKIGRIARGTDIVEQIKIELERFENNNKLDETNFVELYSYVRISSWYYLSIGKFDKAEALNDKVKSLFDRNPSYISEHPMDYFRIIGRVVIISNMLQKFEKSLNTLSQARKISDVWQSKEMEVIVFENCLFHEVEVYLYKKDFGRAVELIESNIDEMNAIKNQMNVVNQKSKFYRIALAYFGAGMYRKSLHWLNEILNNDKMKYRSDIQSSVRILYLFVHYKIGNYRYVESRIRATENYLKKIDCLYPPEKFVLSAMRSISPSKAPSIKALKKLIERLEENVKINPLDEYFFAYFDLLEWLRKEVI